MPHRLTTPQTPEAWLLLLKCRDDWLVNGVYDSPDQPNLIADRARTLSFGHEVRIVQDHPSLEVQHHGLRTHTPSWLRARDNWFLRYESQLEPYLVDPRVAQAFTYEPGNLTDPFCSFKAKTGGPCPLPHGTEWPSCGYCSTRMVMVGVLDFREFQDVPVPKGSLVVHGCPECMFCADEETWAVNWLIDGEPIDLHGDAQAEVQIGQRWRIAEYLTPPMDVHEALGVSLRRSIASRGELRLYCNFTSSFDKVGGHVFWIQGEEFANTPYVYIGQITGEDESLRNWDSPVVYLMYDPATGKTIASLQSF